MNDQAVPTVLGSESRLPRRATATVPEVALLTDSSAKALYALIADGRAPFRAIRLGRKIAIPRVDLESLFGESAVSEVLDHRQAVGAV